MQRPDLAVLRRAKRRADTYRALRFQGGAVVAILAALRFLPL